MPGWIILSHNNDGEAQCIFTDMKETKQENVPVIIDERLCSDTIFRAVKLSRDIFLIVDIYYLNGSFLHGRKNFEERKQIISELLDLFHTTDLAAFFSIDDVPVGTPIRGYEYYDILPGSIGIFVEGESK